MTEKRFKLGYVCGDFGLIDNGVWVDLHSMSENSEKNVQICINKMNALHEENEQLKSDNNRLVNETAKVVAEHQRKVFELIDEKIDELEKRYKFGQEVYKGCPMHNIQFGINTLKELKKELVE